MLQGEAKRTYNRNYYKVHRDRILDQVVDEAMAPQNLKVEYF